MFQLWRFNMHDLVGAYERMNQVYQWYIESAFPLRYHGLSEERQKLLVSARNLVSATTVGNNSSLSYVRVMNLEKQVNCCRPEYQDLQYLAQALFPSDIQLWRTSMEKSL